MHLHPSLHNTLQRYSSNNTKPPKTFHIDPIIQVELILKVLLQIRPCIIREIFLGARKILHIRLFMHFDVYHCCDTHVCRTWEDVHILRIIYEIYFAPFISGLVFLSILIRSLAFSVSRRLVRNAIWYYFRKIPFNRI